MTRKKAALLGGGGSHFSVMGLAFSFVLLALP